MARVAIIGGGAAGIFAAIQAAQGGAEVQVFEAGPRPLAKVRIAGGGRCNLTHDCPDPAAFATSYPRGERELRAAFGRFQATDCQAWFRQRGVALKTEADGRVFPVSDDSATIVDCLLDTAQQAGVQLHLRSPVRTVQRVGTGFTLKVHERYHAADRLLLASGGAREGLRLAAELGHRIVPPVPALFTLRCRDPLLAELAGIAAPVALRLQAAGSSEWHAANGPLLITHWGLSGPALLKASSWAARDLAAASWQGTVIVNWCPDGTEAALRAELRHRREDEATRSLAAHPRPGLPRRLWARLVTRAGLSGTWAGQSNAQLEALRLCLQACELQTCGKGPFSEEFVVTGGIERRELDWRRMESRLVPGLFAAGEIIDQDGLTGGFNLQAAWTTGWIAGRALAEGH